MVKKALLIAFFIEAALILLLYSKYDMVSHIIPYFLFSIFLPTRCLRWSGVEIVVASIIMNAILIFISCLGILKLMQRVKYILILLFTSSFFFICGVTISNILIEKAMNAKPFSKTASNIERLYKFICPISYRLEKVKYGEWYLTGQPFSISEPNHQLAIANGLSYAITIHFIVLYHFNRRRKIEGILGPK